MQKYQCVPHSFVQTQNEDVHHYLMALTVGVASAHVAKLVKSFLDIIAYLSHGKITSSRA
jgi:hypothetical protein